MILISILAIFGVCFIGGFIYKCGNDTTLDDGIKSFIIALIKLPFWIYRQVEGIQAPISEELQIIEQYALSREDLLEITRRLNYYNLPILRDFKVENGAEYVYITAEGLCEKYKGLSLSDAYKKLVHVIETYYQYELHLNPLPIVLKKFTSKELIFKIPLNNYTFTKFQSTSMNQKVRLENSSKQAVKEHGVMKEEISESVGEI